MAKIAFLGAGSTVFAKNLMGDILSFPELAIGAVGAVSADGAIGAASAVGADGAVGADSAVGAVGAVGTDGTGGAIGAVSAIDGR